MNFKNDDFVPNYVKIQNYILEKIQHGEYKSGDKIPAETELARQFSVSRVTANMAIKELSIMGVVQRVKGKGTYVSDTDNVPNTSKVLSPNMQLKTTYDAKSHRLDQAKVIELYPELQRKFNLTDNKLVYEIIRSVHHKDKVIALDYSYIPFSYFGSIPIQPDEITKNYLHEYLRKCTSCQPSSVKIYINTPHYPFLDVSALEPSAKSDLLVWTTDVFDAHKQLIASTITLSPQNHEKEPFITFSI